MAEKEEKVILIADYGRSGQGWLSYMLCYILNAKYIETYDFLRGTLYAPKETRDVTSGNLPNREKTQYSMVIKTHEYPAQEFNLTDKVIFFSRDPRDIAISGFKRSRIREKDEKNISLRNRIYYLIHHFKLTSLIMTSHKWKKHYSMWHERKDIHFYQTSYEALTLDTEKTLRGILDYLNIKAPDSLIKESIERFSFERMSGRKKGEEDSNNSIFRKGIVGDHKNNFSKLELKIFDLICGKEAKDAGYNLSE